MKNLLYLSILLSLLGCAENKIQNIDSYTIEQFFKNNRIGGGAFSSDELKLLFSSDESGIFNVHEVNLLTKEIKPITESKVESYFAVDYVPNSKDILYTADKGGNEIDHIYKLSADGQLKDLTPGENEKADFWSWSDDDKYMYYSSNKRDEKYFDLYKMSTTNWEPQMIYQNDDGIGVTDFSKDESTFAISKTITTSSNQLWVYNKATEKKIEISDPENPGSYSSSGFSNDGQLFYYISDKGKEFAYLKERNLASGDEKVIFE